MGEQDNARIQSYFGGAFPILEPGTALLEGAFTPPPFRGKGIMGLAMSLSLLRRTVRFEPVGAASLSDAGPSPR